MNLNSALKTFLGLIVLLVGFWAMVDPSWFGQNSWLYGLGWWIYTWDIIRGSVANADIPGHNCHLDNL